MYRSDNARGEHCQQDGGKRQPRDDGPGKRYEQDDRRLRRGHGHGRDLARTRRQHRQAFQPPGELAEGSPAAQLSERGDHEYRAQYKAARQRYIDHSDSASCLSG
jgi:hypothetical protein